MLRDPAVPLGTNPPNVALPIHGLVPTTRVSGHGVKLVHIATTGQFAPIIRRLNQAVVAYTIVLQRLVASPAVLLPEERPKEHAIDLVHEFVLLVHEALTGGYRRGDLFHPSDRRGKRLPFGRGIRTDPIVQGRGDINTVMRTVMAILQRHLRYTWALLN